MFKSGALSFIIIYFCILFKGPAVVEKLTENLAKEMESIILSPEKLTTPPPKETQPLSPDEIDDFVLVPSASATPPTPERSPVRPRAYT